jgi:hypothetical protein
VEAVADLLHRAGDAAGEEVQALGGVALRLLPLAPEEAPARASGDLQESFQVAQVGAQQGLGDRVVRVRHGGAGEQDRRQRWWWIRGQPRGSRHARGTTFPTVAAFNLDGSIVASGRSTRAGCDFHPVPRGSSMLPAIPDPLLRAVEQRKCVLFVGPGLSSLAGYPTWSELVDLLVAEARKMPRARTDGLEKFQACGDYFTLAEFARSTLPRDEFRQILKREFGRPVPSTPAHEAIAGTDYRGFITTNYDRLLESAVTQVRMAMPSTFTPSSYSELASALYDPDTFVFKMHGDLLEPSSVVISASDYDRLILRSPHVRSFLQAVFISNTLLFVGYSLRDPDFQLILKELTLIFQGYLPRHFALLASPGSFEIDHLLRQMNVQAIPYDSGDNHRAVLDVLLYLQDLAPATVAAAT